MRKINKVCSIIFSAILGIQSIGFPSVFAEMTPVEKGFFDSIEEGRHNPRCRSEGLIHSINTTVCEKSSVDFKLYCLSILFRLNANEDDINRFISRNGINLDDTSSLCYTDLIYRAIYYCCERALTPDVSITNEELKENLIKILSNGKKLLLRILRNKGEFRKCPDYFKKHIMRSLGCIRKHRFNFIPEEELKPLLENFKSEDFKSSVGLLFPYIKSFEIDNSRKIKLIEEVTQGFRNIDELLKDKDCRCLMVEYSRMPEGNCMQRYNVVRKLIEYYRNTMSIPNNCNHAEYPYYLEAISVIATIPVGDNNYKKEIIQEFLNCYKKTFKKSALSNEQNAKMIIYICRKIGIDDEYKIKLLKEIIKCHKELNDPLYEDAVLTCGKIPEYDTEEKRKLLGELINYYRKNSKDIKDILVNTKYVELVLVYGRIPGGDLKYKEGLMEELIDDYKIRLGESAISDHKYGELVLTYARIPGGDLENKEKLLEKLINYYQLNPEKISQDDSKYQQAVLAYARIPEGDWENKENLLEELIKHYQSIFRETVQNDSNYQQAVLAYAKIRGGDLENKEKLLEELINYYQLKFGKTVQSDSNYQQAVLTYAKIPRSNLGNRRNLLIELIKYCIENSENDEDKLKNPLYEKSVLAYGTLPVDNSEYKVNLLKELIDFYKTDSKYDSLANKTMVAYIKIPISNLKCKIEYLEKLVKAGLGSKYNLSGIIRNIMKFEWSNLDDSQKLKLREWEQECYGEGSDSFAPGSRRGGRGGYVPRKDSGSSSRGGRGGYVPRKDSGSSSRGGRGGYVPRKDSGSSSRGGRGGRGRL